MIKAKKSLGQNFLDDTYFINRIIGSVRANQTDVVLEIGPGTGALTKQLVEQAGFVVAVELDLRLIDKLRSEIKRENFKLIEADALNVNWQHLLDEAIESWRKLYQGNAAEPRIRVVANLPYYISTAILERLLQLRHRIFDMTLMLQEEVVDRITSSPNNKDYGYLSVLVQYFCEATKLFTVPAEAFTPAPKVQSAIVRLTTRSKPYVQIKNEKKFFALVRASFAQRRKTIQNNLIAAASICGFDQTPARALENCGLDAKRRAETFSLRDFEKLYHSLYREEII